MLRLSLVELHPFFREYQKENFGFSKQNKKIKLCFIMRSNVFVLLVCGLGLARGQSGVNRQIRLEDIERDNLKASGEHQSQQQPPPSPPSNSPYQQQQLLQYLTVPQAGAGHQLFAHPQYNPSQLSAYHQQVLFSPSQQPLYIPQNQPLPFPVMLISTPYLLPQDLNSIFQIPPSAAKYTPASVQQIPTTSSVKPFRPSPPLNYSPQPQSHQSINPYQQQPQYNAYQTVYQQKYATGVKSTVSPPLKDNYVQQTNNYGYKLQ